MYKITSKTIDQRLLCHATFHRAVADSVNLIFPFFGITFSVEARRFRGWRNMSRSGFPLPKTSGKLSVRNRPRQTPVCGCGSQLTAAVIGGDYPETGFKKNKTILVLGEGLTLVLE